jgi:hypothetical protein
MRRVGTASWPATETGGNLPVGGTSVTEALGAALRGNTDTTQGYPPFVQVNFIIKD